MPAIVPIVEGFGDIDATPLLVKRVLQERLHRYDIRISRPIAGHGKDGAVVRLERFIELALRVPNRGAILVLLDSGTTCHRPESGELSSRIRALKLPVPAAVVLAVHEFEAWFIASIEAIRGKPIKGRPGLDPATLLPPSSEGISGAKEWLTRYMPPGRAYKETLDQAALAAMISLELAFQHSRSFRRLCHAIEQLVEAMDTGSVAVTP